MICLKGTTCKVKGNLSRRYAPAEVTLQLFPVMFVWRVVCPLLARPAAHGGAQAAVVRGRNTILLHVLHLTEPALAGERVELQGVSLKST